MVGEHGDDEDLGREAAERARGWLRGDRVVDPDMVVTVMSVAARHADRALFDEMVAAALEEPDRERRGTILSALGDVGDPVLAREALALFLDERVDPREAFGLAARMSRHRATRLVLWTFLEESWEAVTGRLPRSAVAYLPGLARLACSPAGEIQPRGLSPAPPGRGRRRTAGPGPGAREGRPVHRPARGPGGECRAIPREGHGRVGGLAPIRPLVDSIRCPGIVFRPSRRR